MTAVVLHLHHHHRSYPPQDPLTPAQSSPPGYRPCFFGDVVLIWVWFWAVQVAVKAAPAKKAAPRVAAKAAPRPAKASPKVCMARYCCTAVLY